MRWATILALILTAEVWAGEKPPVPFKTINCRPDGGKCQHVEFPEARAYQLFAEVVAGFKINPAVPEPKPQFINPRFEIGDQDVRNGLEYWQKKDKASGQVMEETVCLSRWSDQAFAVGWARLLNDKISPALSDEELQRIVNLAVVNIRYRVGVKELEKGK